MIKRGLVLSLITFLIASLFFEATYYGDRLIEEFQNTEDVETKTVYEIDTYNPNDTDGIYLTFRYTDSKTGKEYSSSPIFTRNKSYKVGDMVEVVTRNGRPDSLLSSTKRGRKRTALERATDTGYDCGMILHIIVTVTLLLIFTIPNRKMISEECRRRKKFIIRNSLIYAVFTLAATALWIIGVHVNGWDGLGYAFFSLLLYAGSSFGQAIAWLVNSIKLRKERNDNT